MKTLPRLILFAAAVLAGSCTTTTVVPYDEALEKLGDAPWMGLTVDGYISVNGIVHPESAIARLAGSDMIAFTPQEPHSMFPETVLLSENQVRDVRFVREDALKTAGFIVAIPILIPVAVIFWLPSLVIVRPDGSWVWESRSGSERKFGIDYTPRPEDWPVAFCVLEPLHDEFVGLTGVEVQPLPAGAQLIGRISKSRLEDQTFKAAKATARSFGGDVIEVRSISKRWFETFVYRTGLEDFQ